MIPVGVEFEADVLQANGLLPVEFDLSLLVGGVSNPGIGLIGRACGSGDEVLWAKGTQRGLDSEGDVFAFWAALG